MQKQLWLLLSCFTFLSCTVTRNYDPNKKYSEAKLKSDFTLLRNILKEKHPSLYWYTSKDSMDFYLDQGFNAIKDSMTELQFAWKVLAPVTAAIHCGHTSFGMSKNWYRFIKNRQIPSFPLLLKVWKDSMMVVVNLNNDSIVRPGDFITSINGVGNKEIIQKIFKYLPEDGYSSNVNYIRLSASFPYFHRNVFGLYEKYFVTFSDSNNVSKEAVINWWRPKEDSSESIKKSNREHVTSREKREDVRSLEIDSTIAYMPVNAFSKAHLNGFFKKSFRKIRKEKVRNLIIDLRVNGGGDINKAVALAKYVSKKPFKVADSAYSISKNFNPYAKYINHTFWNNLALTFVSRKRSDGKFHFGFWEHHMFKPKRRNHFDGKVFILTNGLTFSASSLFCNLVKGQENVIITGEETGGGWYGNSGILIPEITLPNTKLRVRLPFFRLVQYNHVPFKGTGVIPDWYIGPNWRDVLTGKDTKLEAVKEKILGH